MVQLHSFLTSALDGGEWLTSYPREINPLPIEEEAGSVPESVWTVFEEKNLLSVPGIRNSDLLP
jgi:hypothetical protein